MTAGTDEEPQGARLQHYPISIFGITMGLFGLALALRAGGFSVMQLREEINSASGSEAALHVPTVPEVGGEEGGSPRPALTGCSAS